MSRGRFRSYKLRVLPMLACFVMATLLHPLAVPAATLTDMGVAANRSGATSASKSKVGGLDNSDMSDVRYTIAFSNIGPGTVRIGGVQPTTHDTYGSDEIVEITPFPAYIPRPTGSYFYFVQWKVDGYLVGWGFPLLLPINGQNHTVEAYFTSGSTWGLGPFPDVYTSNATGQAVANLYDRGIIRGYADGTFGPNDKVQRAQMAALIARATPLGPGIPSILLSPPACQVSQTWDCEDWGNNFKDQNGVDAGLWRNVGTLQHYRIAFGYTASECAKRRTAAPCFGPSDLVSYAQTVSLITRTMVAKGYWIAQPAQPIPYEGVSDAYADDFRTFHYYTQERGGIPAAPLQWDAAATRGWFAMVLWAALDSYWSTNRLP